MRHRLAGAVTSWLGVQGARWSLPALVAVAAVTAAAYGVRISGLGGIDSEIRVPVSLLLAPAAGVIAAVGCTAPVKHEPKPLKLIAARLVWAAALGGLAIGATAVSLGTYRSLQLAALVRNVLLAQGAGLILVAGGLAALAWAPATCWLLAAMLLGGGTDGRHLGFAMMLASKAAPGALPLAAGVWAAGALAYALLAGGRAPRRHRAPRGDLVARGRPGETNQPPGQSGSEATP
ncbi:MAG: hypothetical protein LBR19_05390 [Bifidobacteriaceae bacterium]|jgi:hypothetical protein|nr:hypothetical protein [Bifidobacteriaceae bacterium]